MFTHKYIDENFRLRSNYHSYRWIMFAQTQPDSGCMMVKVHTYIVLNHSWRESECVGVIHLLSQDVRRPAQ